MKNLELHIYTFGYWGWGTHTKELLAAIDKSETKAGFRPPFFVDIRFNRAVRAAGFRGDAFRNLVGKKRYQWMKRLGNCNIGTNTSGIKIADPSAATELLDLALDAAKRNQRVVVFCACEITSLCHRHTVAKLLAKEAKKRGLTLSTTEWPGGKPQQVELSISSKLFKEVKHGRKSVPLPKACGKLCALPWHSVVKLVDESTEEFLLIVTGPAKYANEPYLPILDHTRFGVPKWR